MPRKFISSPALVTLQTNHFWLYFVAKYIKKQYYFWLYENIYVSLQPKIISIL